MLCHSIKCYFIRMCVVGGIVFHIVIRNLIHFNPFSYVNKCILLSNLHLYIPAQSSTREDNGID